VLAVKLPEFAGLVRKELQPGRRFGTELADHAKLYGKVGGISHTDELPAYGISADEVEKLRTTLEASERDAIIIVADRRDNAEAALSAVVDRANQALIGVPEETRRTLPDGNTVFMRPLPGAGRLYPETDIPPIPIRSERLREIKKSLPKLPEQKSEQFVREYGLSEELAKRMSLSEDVDLFEELIRKTKAEPMLIATTLEETLVGLRREGIPVENIQEHAFVELFDLVAKKRLAKEAIPEILKEVSKGLNVREAIEKLGLKMVTKSELKRLIREIVDTNKEMVRERGMRAMGPLMGILMGKVRGRADGELVYRLLEQELKKLGERG
jgi:glutamyl-tRNA(Gln) amidotransferase subunit E